MQKATCNIFHAALEYYIEELLDDPSFVLFVRTPDVSPGELRIGLIEAANIVGADLEAMIEDRAACTEWTKGRLERFCREESLPDD